ncbi:MAG: hypothetical protein NC184_06655 [Roseburia sp.]|nr:hypothetical protein [Roseburia sp.]
MSLKRELAREIRVLEEEIKILEIKRSRSQASLIESLISRTEPNESELSYFRAFTAEIEVKREQLQKLVNDLDSIV